MKDFLKFLARRLYFYWHRRNGAAYVDYLKKKGVRIGENVYFRHPTHTTIDVTRPLLVTFGNNVDINDNFTIMTHDFGTYVFRGLYGDFVACSGGVNIGSNIYIARDVTILKGVTIGDNCIIGLGSVVTKDVPANSVVCGVPAKVVCTIEDYYKKRKEAQVLEAIKYAIAIKNSGREPQITDFTEEWVLFLNENDIKEYPEMMRHIDLRIKDKEKFAIHQHLVFDGFRNFIKEVEKQLEQHGTK